MVEWDEEMEARWQRLADEVMTGMKEWRLAHPKATFREMEEAIDERWSRARARMLEDMALASKAADITKAQEEERPGCPKCGHTLEAQGQQTRSVTTSYNRKISLRRSYAKCPACGAGLFPPG